MKNLLLLLILTVALSSFQGIGLPAYAGDYRIITDMDDNQIEVPVNPKRIACMHGVSSDRIVMLGKGDCLALMMKPFPWAYRLYPELKNVETAQPPFTGDVERLLNLKVDLVLYSPSLVKQRSTGLRESKRRADSRPKRGRGPWSNSWTTSSGR